VTFRPRALDPHEKNIALDAARGLTVPESAASRGLTAFQVYEVHRRLKTLLGARTVTHVVALAIAYGDITHEEIKGKP
jgi:DNA-binding CsgD family transcriptional regulator